MAKQMYFGNLTHSQWVPCPATGMNRSAEGYSDEIRLNNGGLWIERSSASHAVYDMQFPVQDSSIYEGIEAFARFAAGQYGTGYLHFVDPMVQDQNLFTEVWASPGLSEYGHKAIYDTVPTYGATTTNSYNKPARKPTFAVTTATAAVPVGQNSVFTLLIPPTCTLSLGASGTVTGDAVLRVQPINTDGTNGSVVDIIMTADTAAPAFSSTFSGTTFKAVKVYITRTSSSASTITPTAVWAQIVTTGVTPTITRHLPGKGHSGLQFRGDVRAEEYVMSDRHLMGASITLAEIEPWA